MRVPVRFNTRVLGWNSGCTVSGRSFFEGGWVTNCLRDVLLKWNRWWSGWWLVRRRWSRALLLVVKWLVCCDRCDCSWGIRYRRVCWSFPRRKIGISTTLECSCSSLPLHMHTLHRYLLLCEILHLVNHALSFFSVAGAETCSLLLASENLQAHSTHHYLSIITIGNSHHRHP